MSAVAAWLENIHSVAGFFFSLPKTSRSRLSGLQFSRGGKTPPRAALSFPHESKWSACRLAPMSLCHSPLICCVKERKAHLVLCSDALSHPSLNRPGDCKFLSLQLTTRGRMVLCCNEFRCDGALHLCCQQQTQGQTDVRFWPEGRSSSQLTWFWLQTRLLC